MSKERPILFSGPMVRALLDGSKTQTRRVAKQKVAETLEWFGGKSDDDDDRELAELLGQRTEEKGLRVWCHDYPEEGSVLIRCPYGQPGDRLWVRETWQGPLLQEFEVDADPDWHYASHIHQYQNPAHCEYAADGGPKPEYTDADDVMRQGWRPSIHMPRWASRITLGITSVRVERLQDISEADAIAEGCTKNHNGYYWGGPHPVSGLKQLATAKGAYQDLWESINGPDSWAANPRVWAIEFRRLP